MAVEAARQLKERRVLVPTLDPSAQTAVARQSSFQTADGVSR
ncbi:hypothetical protein [Streptomyces sp. NPDC050264]